MKPSIAILLLLGLAACRIERVRANDSGSAGAEPGPGVAACGISPESRVSDDGIGLLRIGVSIDALRASCAILAEQIGTDTSPGSARIDLGRDTATVELKGRGITRIVLHHQAYRTADSLGVGTHVTTLMRLREATGVTDRGKLYAVSPAACGLRFMLAEPAPAPPAAQSGRAALRRLAGEVRTRELEIIGCSRRR